MIGAPLLRGAQSALQLLDLVLERLQVLHIVHCGVDAGGIFIIRLRPSERRFIECAHVVRRKGILVVGVEILRR